jgi:TrmH family RNA methyltransferase
MTDSVAQDAPPELLGTHFRVVLVDTSLPRNIGSAARAMRVMGLKQLVLANPARFPHPEATALASGADEVLEQALVVPDLAEALNGCVLAMGCSARRREIDVPQIDAREAGLQAVRTARAGGMVALVFGSERVGLTNTQMAQCQFLVNIPTAADFSSLNLASAVQLLSYECRMAALSEGAISATIANNQMPSQHAPERPATLDQQEGFFQHLERTLVLIEFFGDRSQAKLMQRLRRLYQRAAMSEREIHILRGVLTETERQCKRRQQS